MSETFQIETKEGLFDVLNQLVNMRVSDIYVTASKPLEIRKLGDLFRTNTVAPSEEVMIDFLNSVGDIKIEGKLSNIEEHPAGEIDGALSMPAENGCPSQRLRYNFFRLLDPGTKRQTVKLALRPLSDKIPAPEELMIPPDLVQHIDKQSQGLVLVCGKTGAGKSTSLAAILQHRADKFKEHIVTLEQPIE